jgi:hypothetical protein
MMHSIIAAFDAAIAANQGKLSGFPGTYNTRHIIFEFENRAVGTIGER